MNVIGTIAVVVITSLYYFPFNCSLFPSVNTKLILASIGLLLFAFNSSMRRNAEVGDTFAKVSAWAAIHTPAISYPPGFGWEVHIL